MPRRLRTNRPHGWRGWAFTVLLPCAVTAAAGGELTETELPASVAWLFEAPPDGTELALRLTSVDRDGGRQVALMRLRHRRGGLVAHLEVEILGHGDTAAHFRLQSGADGVPVLLKGNGSPRDASLDECVPGTALRWRAMTLGAASHGVWALRAIERADANGPERVRLVSTAQAPATGAASVEVILGQQSGLPQRLVFRDNAEKELFTVEILETRETRWGRAVTRSVVHDVRTGARVLIEVRGGGVDGPGGRAAAPPSDSGDRPQSRHGGRSL